MQDTAVKDLSSQPADQRRAAIREALEENPRQMTLILARQLGVPEVEVIRAMPLSAVQEMDVSAWEAIIRSFESLGDVHVIASNGSVTLECFGTFGNFSSSGDYFNVQNKSLDMHIRTKTLGAVFVVEKPGHMDGVATVSFQFYNLEGASAFKVFTTFGGKEPSAQLRAKCQAIRDRFKL